MELTPQQTVLCKEFAQILGGEASVINGVCTVTLLRNNIHATIQGRNSRSVVTIAALFSFESMDPTGRALLLGETVILQEEINPFTTKLRQFGIEVTALHNHWLFDNPTLLYIHFQTIEKPLVFAAKLKNSMSVLTNKPVYAS